MASGLEHPIADLRVASQCDLASETAEEDLRSALSATQAQSVPGTEFRRPRFHKDTLALLSAVRNPDMLVL